MKATKETMDFIGQWWDGDDLQTFEDNPARFVKEIANPWLREQRRKGKDFPLLRLERGNWASLIVSISYKQHAQSK